MALSIEKALPPAADVAALYPVTDAHQIDEHRAAVRSILDGTDERARRIMVVGPCSAWPSDAVERYSDKLAELQEAVRDKLLLIMRVYIQKPRTTVGWSGPLNQLDPLGVPDIETGIWECRRLMHSIGQKLPLADEMLFTHNADYFAPLLSYVAVGARSAEDMEHRYLASGLEIPVGMKNPTSGDIEIGVNSVISAQHPHTFAYHDHQVRTTGNPYAHLILRGGKHGGNIDPHSLAKAHHLLLDKKIVHPSIIVDASHDNSLNGHGKDARLQGIVIRQILLGIEEKRAEYESIKGWMLESFLVEGNQKISSDMRRDGLSITDPCLGWNETEKLIRRTADTLASL